MDHLMNDTLSKIVDFLNVDQFRHLVHLKYLRLYADSIQYHFFDENDPCGVLLRYPTQAVSWDASYYPHTTDVLLPVASNYAVARKVAQFAVDTVPSASPIVIKFCERETKAAFGEVFSLAPARVFLSYSTRLPIPASNDDHVMVSAKLDETCAALYLKNGYSRADLDKHFADGALSFTRYEGHEPVCTCFVFRNLEAVWEIGGVHTVEQVRRKGYARLVVQKAVNTLLERSHLPRYQTDAANIPSIQLAESIGLRPYLRFEHYLATPKS
jgi:RimJ/RimL family protein N-acetyltransferase